MHITQVHIEDIRPLGNISFDCNERLNLFIGPNSSGKSTILRAVEGFYSLAVKQGVIFNEEYGEYNLPVILESSDDWPRDSLASDSVNSVRWDEVPLLYIPATRVNLPGMHIFEVNTIDRVGNAQVDDPLEALFETRTGVFNGHYVEQVKDWILQENGTAPIYASELQRLQPNEFQRLMEERRRRRETKLRQQYQLRKALEVGYFCTKSICPEVIRGDAPRNYVEFDPGREIVPPSWVTRRGMGIMTTDNIFDEPLYAGALSSGTQGTLLWVWALALKIALHYLWEEDWQKKPAILLIDEIENHLHPTWQRRVIPALLEHFPGLQIFATTHSPFVVAGLKAGQVHLLNRDSETGAVTSSTNDRDVIGWTADEILRNMMGVDEPTDQLTVDRANRLRRLREKETLSPEEESELNDLRRQVNQDFLNKAGPLEAQRERYADLMQQFLLSRQSDLTQDGK